MRHSDLASLYFLAQNTLPVRLLWSRFYSKELWQDRTWTRQDPQTHPYLNFDFTRWMQYTDLQPSTLNKQGNNYDSQATPSSVFTLVTKREGNVRKYFWGQQSVFSLVKRNGLERKRNPVWENPCYLRHSSFECLMISGISVFNPKYTDVKSRQIVLWSFSSALIGKFNPTDQHLAVGPLNKSCVRPFLS